MKAQRPALGIALIALMTVCFAAMDTAVRWLGAFLPILLLLTARYLVQAVSMGLWLAVHPRHGFRSTHPRFQALRGSLLLVTSIFSFIGLQYVPVPELTAIYMLTPLLVTLLAATVLREPVSALRWALVAGGFIGALMVIRPGSGGLGWAILLPLAGTCCYAAFQLLTRRLAGLENPLTTHFWTGFVGAAVLLPLLLAGPVDVYRALSAAPAGHLALLALIGALGTGGHLMLIVAMGLAPTATLMPFVYLQIAAAAACAWLVFQHLPDPWAWAGMGVIAVCGAASAWLNTRAVAVSPVEADTLAD
jgi:drug/metabolite transporter (DMT)-like permease